MHDAEDIRGNRGEWSELYTLGYLLGNGGAFGADENQSRMEDLFYKVLEIFLAGKTPDEELQYKISEDKVKILVAGTLVNEISRSEITSQVEEFFGDLTKYDIGPTFPLASGSKLLEDLNKKTISAPSTQHTSDMDIVFEDRDSKLPTPRVGFSIKSQVGNASTLLNAGKGTNFEYEIEIPDSEDSTYLKNMDQSKVRANLSRMVGAGYKFKFSRILSENFQMNLELLDSRMPEYLAELLLNFYSGKSSKFSEVVDQTFPQSEKLNAQKYFKMKQFLGVVAMGMRPNDEWDGDVTKFKGLIVVKTDGDVVFYYLYNINNFQDFLFNSVKFEVASTSRHQFGFAYEEQGKWFIRLNLQIRFVK
jgi:type II restriction enzyme